MAVLAIIILVVLIVGGAIYMGAREDSQKK